MTLFGCPEAVDVELQVNIGYPHGLDPGPITTASILYELEGCKVSSAGIEIKKGNDNGNYHYP